MSKEDAPNFREIIEEQYTCANCLNSAITISDDCDLLFCYCHHFDLPEKTYLYKCDSWEGK
jgi:hypothetical protein